jgi:predicted CxxxxCH...CXXCH cytochrome family protein
MKLVQVVIQYKLAIVSLVIAFSLFGNANAGWVEDAIAERIKPVGSVCVAGDDCAKGLLLAAAGPKSGEEVYNSSCLACHSSGAAGAPKFRNAGDWAGRLAASVQCRLKGCV